MSILEPMTTGTRQRLSRRDRFVQLIETARQIIREEGTDGLTLGRLAEKAGVSRPVVYDHFETRNGLLKALYEDYDNRRDAVLAAVLDTAPSTLADRAMVIARTYIECVVGEGADIPGVAAALAGSPELQLFRQEYQDRFFSRFRSELQQFDKKGVIDLPRFLAVVGAADALSGAVATGRVSAEHAEEELTRFIVAAVLRN